MFRCYLHFACWFFASCKNFLLHSEMHILSISLASKRLEEQNKIVEQLEEVNENLNRKIYKLEQQLLSRNEHSTQQTHRDQCGSVDEIRIRIKHKVMCNVFPIFSSFVRSMLNSFRHFLNMNL